MNLQRARFVAFMAMSLLESSGGAAFASQHMTLPRAQVSNVRAITAAGSWISPWASRQQIIYLSVPAQVGKVLMYTLQGTLVGELRGINGGPYGIAVDRNGNLYVVADGGGTIREYKRGAKRPFRTMTDTSGKGYDAITVGLDGTTYAILNYFEGYGGCVNAFAKGSTTPTSIACGPELTALHGVTTDRSGNVYVGYNHSSSSGSGPSGVMYWTAGLAKGPTFLPITDLYLPQALDATQNGTLAVCDEGGSGEGSSGSYIKTYAIGQASPVSEFPSTCFDISLASGQTRIVATVPNGFLRLAYPSGHVLGAVSNLAGVFSVAVSGAVTD